MLDLQFQYPTPYLLLCLLAGLLVAGVLYYRDHRFSDRPAWIRILMACLRFLAVSLLCLLLLTPLLKTSNNEVRKPTVVIAQDVSASAAYEWPDDQKQTFQQAMNQLSQSLSEAYEVKHLAFGDEVRDYSDTLAWNDKTTRFSAAMQEIEDRYVNSNLSAVVLASDGLFNVGSNPIYVADQLNAPVYTIALGDTTIQQDLKLKRVFHNRIAYLGDRFNTEIDIEAKAAKGAMALLTIVRASDGKRVHEEKINVDSDDYFSTRTVTLDALTPGVQRYRVALRRTDGQAEKLTANNAQDFYIEILDARQKILLLAHAPHPDITALKQAITSNKNYEAKVAYAYDFKEKVEEYDLVVLHQLPSKQHGIPNILKTIYSKGISHLYIMGMQTSIPAVNNAQQLLSLKVENLLPNDVQATIDPTFSAFTLSDNLRRELPRFVPLKAHFGQFAPKGGAKVMLYQKIGKIDTESPLLLFSETGGTRSGLLAAEGLWQWRLFDYLQHENHEIFNEFVTKTIQYLSVRQDKRRFRVKASENIYNEGNAVTIDAELYNASYELVNNPDASLVITNAEGDRFEYTFSRNGLAYTLDAGLFPPGEYRYEGSVQLEGKTLTHSGRFSVKAIQLESFETTANHELLRQLSAKYGGFSVAPTAIERIQEQLLADPAKPVIYESSTVRPAIHLKWLFFILLALLSGEWFLRRYLGQY